MSFDKTNSFVVKYMNNTVYSGKYSKYIIVTIHALSTKNYLISI
jgi:hypothetical protein